MALSYNNTTINEAYSKMNASEKIAPAKKQSDQYGKHPARCIMEAYKNLGKEVAPLEAFNGAEAINEAKIDDFGKLKEIILKKMSITGKDKKDVDELSAMKSLRKVKSFKDMKKVLKDKYHFGKAEFKELESIVVDAQFESVSTEDKRFAFMVNEMLTIEAIQAAKEFLESLNEKSFEDITEAEKKTVIQLFTTIYETEDLSEDELVEFVEAKMKDGEEEEDVEEADQEEAEDDEEEVDEGEKGVNPFAKKDDKEKSDDDDKDDKDSDDDDKKDDDKKDDEDDVEEATDFNKDQKGKDGESKDVNKDDVEDK